MNIAPIMIALCSWTCIHAGLHAQVWQGSTAAAMKRSRVVCDSLYGSLWGYTNTVEFRSYLSKDDVVANDVQFAKVRLEGTRFRSEFAGSVTVQDQRIRVVVEPGGQRLLVMDPAPLKGNQVLEIADLVTGQAESILTRAREGGTEHRIVHGERSQYAHTDELYDARGWLRRSQTVWRVPVESAAGPSANKLVLPRLEVAHGIPVPTRINTHTPATDPWTIVESKDGRISGRGQYAGSEVIDMRILP